MAKGRVITSLDIGTNSVKVLVVSKTAEGIEVLSQARESVFGVRNGVVINIEEVAKTIALALRRAQDLAGEKIRDVYVNVNGCHLVASNSHGTISVSRADGRVSQEDVDRVLQAVQTFSLSPNKEIIGAFPKEFIVDGEKGIKNALDLTGVRLETEALVITAFTPYINNLTEAVLGSDVQILDGFLPSPLASARAVLTPREKELGVAVVDIGAGTTGMAVFEEGMLIHFAVHPVGSSHITRDIAIGLTTEFDIAERIKIEFGSCSFRASTKKKPSSRQQIKIEGISLEPNKEAQPLVFSKKTLTDIIQPRASEIFDQVNKELKKISRQKLLPAGIVLTGGGAKLPGIVEFAKKELHLPCRVGLPKEVSVEDTSWSTAAGLILTISDLEGNIGTSFLQNGFFSKLKKIFGIFIP